jgi:hypothetical protein
MTSPEKVDRIVERLLPRTQGEQMWAGMNEDQRRTALGLAVREVLADQQKVEPGTRLADLPVDVREALDQPTRRAVGPVDRVNREVPRV